MDTTIIPEPWGLPPTVTVVAMAKRLAKHLTAPVEGCKGSGGIMMGKTFRWNPGSSRNRLERPLFRGAPGVARCTRGIDGCLRALGAQRSLYAAQRRLIALRLGRLTNEARPYSVTGGGSAEPEMVMGVTDRLAREEAGPGLRDGTRGARSAGSGSGGTRSVG